MLKTGIYTADNEGKPKELLSEGRYCRRKEDRHFWHKVTFDKPVQLKPSRNYTVVCNLKKNGLLHSIKFTSLEVMVIHCLSFRNS